MIGTVADVVVIGAGLSGLELARTLVAAGVKDVLVLDAGEAPAVAAVPAATWRTTAPPHYSAAAAPDRVGGRSLRWHGVVLRLEDWALDASWPAPLRTALTGASGAPGAPSLYAEVERDLAAWAGGPLAGRGADETPELSTAALGPSARPVPLATRPESDGATRAYTPLAECTEWLHRPEGSRLPRIRPGCRAVELVRDAGNVTGVRVAAAGTSEVVPATAVVLAAGTLENTRLMARLPELDGGEFTGLNDHLVQGFVVRLPAGAAGEGTLGDSLRYVAEPACRSNVFARVRPLPTDNGVLVDVWAMGEQVRSAESRLSFPSGGRPPTVVPGLAAADHEVLAGQRELLGRAWSAVASVAGGGGHNLRFPDFRTEPRPFATAVEQVGSAPYRTPVSYAWPLGSVDHEAGTLPLGGEHVDAAGRVRLAAGAYVAGPSTFPRSGAANPSLTTLALARHAARTLVADHC
ncbi:hypothetical protein LAUMK13_03192 [Mycobacterium innocens]|uniref:Glucose-methanol-choline oxidoreductase C-terminal domain-containing protein n=1 Tax=Mycobacterium innocens TaxID=2341083 RepID=A0A498Q8H8_9MYCO|nr:MULTISPECIES: GMC oxidoreductase [Mycobacterium]VBA40705.1 hypothetical protein LAUMK13_03192 [Mycobacterium innocens]